MDSLEIAVQEKEGRRKKKNFKEKIFLVLTPFAWVIKLDRCQNFK